ncbi:type II secretion system protein N [Undibacterium luofuense]|uniref:type II secretion system protein N n=1 Tax=Undibacterium luofuense TaxID=2828733 RepID=UPI0030EF8C4C
MASWQRKLIWMSAALITFFLTIVVFLPAAWLSALLEKQTGGRLSLGDVQGSFWSGSAFVGVAADNNGPVTPVFPGRFSWKISPLLLLGQIEVNLSNPEALSKSVLMTGNVSTLFVSEAVLLLPTERLQGLGAPLNTIGPSGKLDMHWKNLSFVREGTQFNGQGQLLFTLSDMSSRLSPVRPLGSYEVRLDLQGTKMNLQLQTQQGPMMLSGTGGIQGGRLQFSGKAWAQDGAEAKLANLLNLLGQRRKEGAKDVIALEFK